MSYIIAIAAIAAMIGLDQWVKWLAVTHLQNAPDIPLVEGVFRLAYVENRGAAFGLLDGGRWVFVVLTALVLCAIAVYFVRLPKTKQTRLLRAALIILCGGALGNFIDRARQGYVVDMFYFHWFEFPVFNVADILTVCSTFLLCAMILFPKAFKTEFMLGGEKKETQTENTAEETHADTD